MIRGRGEKPLRIAVIGGGITGLAAAHRALQLARRAGRPCRITLFERDRRLGGKVRSQAAGDFLMEVGPDCFLTRKPWMAELCRELGLGGDMVFLGEGPGGKGAAGPPGTFVLVGGTLRRLPPGSFLGIPTRLGTLLGTDLLSWPGKVRFALERFLPPRREDGDESVAAFVRRRLGREAALRLVEPLLAGIHGGDAEQLSVEAAFPVLKAMERRYGSVWAGVRAAAGAAAGRGEGSRSTGQSNRWNGAGAHGNGARGDGSFAQGSGKAAAGPTAPFASLRWGIESAVHALRDELRQAGVDIRLGQGVVGMRLVPREQAAGNGWSAVTPTLDTAPDLAPCPLRVPVMMLRLEDGSEFPADGVVLATPADGAADIVARVAPEAAALLREIPYGSAASVYLGYRRSEVPHPLNGTGYITAREGERPVRASTWVSTKWPHTSGDGSVLIRLHMGAYGGREPTERSDEELIAEARQEMEQVLGVTALPRLVRVFRWPQALPQYLPGHNQRLEALGRALEPLPALQLAGAAYRGVGLPDCVRQGREAAEKVLQALLPRSVLETAGPPPSFISQ